MLFKSVHLNLWSQDNFGSPRKKFFFGNVIKSKKSFSETFSLHQSTYIHLYNKTSIILFNIKIANKKKLFVVFNFEKRDFS